MAIKILIILLVVTSAKLTAAGSGYHYERPQVAFELPATAVVIPTKPTTTTENVVQQRKSSEMHFVRHELNKQPKPQRKSSELCEKLIKWPQIKKRMQLVRFNCTTSKNADLRLKLRQVRPKDRRLTPYTEEIIASGAKHFAAFARRVTDLKAFIKYTKKL